MKMYEVPTEEFIRRITSLATKFSQYKLRFSTYYREIDKIKYGLDKLNITYKEYYGPYYDTYAEDIYDECIILNTDKAEIIEFSYYVSRPTFNPNGTTFTICSKKEILRYILNDPIPESFYNLDIDSYVLFKQILDIIYVKYDPINFCIVQQKKRTFSVCALDTADEKITNDIIINTNHTKKIKIGSIIS